MCLKQSNTLRYYDVFNPARLAEGGTLVRGELASFCCLDHHVVDAVISKCSLLNTCTNNLSTLIHLDIYDNFNLGCYFATR